MSWSLFPPESATDAIAAAATLATVGWVYTARRARSLARKQHTINVILKANFDAEMRGAHFKLTPIFRGNEPFPEIGSDAYKELLPTLRFVLNHFEFIAAGVRRGDMDEQLVKDAQRGTIITAYEKSETHIFAIRSNRRNQAVYEHLEWLHKRWEQTPPGMLTCACEWVRGAPFYGRRISN